MISGDNTDRTNWRAMYNREHASCVSAKKTLEAAMGSARKLIRILGGQDLEGKEDTYILESPAQKRDRVAREFIDRALYD